jgi:iron(III) transport system permease protein
MAAGVSLLGLVPLGYVAVTAILTGAPTLSALVFRARVGELLANTAGLVLITVPLCALVGVTAAWLVGRTRLAGSRAFAILLVVPLAIPAFVNSYGWVTAVPSLNGLWSGVLVAGLSYFPLVYLPTVVALRRLDPAVEESARSLGVAPLGVFFRVVLPQLRLPILGGSLIIGLHLLSEYGAFALIRFDTFTTAIVDQFRSTFNGPAANALAGVLVLSCLFLLVGESGARGGARYARIGGGSARPAERSRFGVWYPAAYLFLGVLVLLSVAVPLASVGRWLVSGGIAAWSDRYLLTTLYQTAALVIVVYLLMFLPRAIVNLRSGLAQVPVGLEEAARSLGRPPLLAFITVTMRFVMPSALAGAALVFLGIVTELTSTLLLAPNGTRTLAIQFWSRVNDIDYVGAAPYASLMILLSLPVTYLLFARSRSETTAVNSL